jgi:hypothetical protein
MYIPGLKTSVQGVEFIPKKQIYSIRQSQTWTKASSLRASLGNYENHSLGKGRIRKKHPSTKYRAILTRDKLELA